MTIHQSHPFADPEPDPVRRLRGRLGGAVSIWTAGDEDGRAGLTVSSLMVSHGEPARVLGLVDPDSDLRDVLERTGRCVVQLLEWEQRGLADAFAGRAPAPGGAFKQSPFIDTKWGPRLADCHAWVALEVESVAEVGWSDLVTGVVADIEIAEELHPLGHRRGRYHRFGLD